MDTDSRKSSTFLAAALLLMSCATSSQPQITSSPVLLHDTTSESEIRRWMAVTKGIGDSGGGNQYCAGDFEIARQGPMPPAWKEGDGLLGHEGCFSYGLIVDGLAGAMKPENVAAVPVEQSLIADLVERLDLASFNSSLRPKFRIGRGPFPMQRIATQARPKIDNNVVKLDVGEDWVFEITVLASGRIGRYPKAVLITVLDRALKGTYLSESDYLVPLVADGPLPVVDVSEEWRHTRIPPLPSASNSR